MDREQLMLLFPLERSRLVASVARLVGPTEAEDIANETLLKALAASGSFRGDAAPGTWLHRIGINLAYDLLRRRGFDPVVSPEDCLEEMKPVPEPNDSDPLEQRQMSQCVQETLASLPAAQRQLLFMADVLDRPTQEIARDDGIAHGNAKIRLHRARRALQTALKGKCDFHYRKGGVLCCTPKPEGA